MKVVIFGGSGMVGGGVLLECLDDARIERVLLVSRQPVRVRHPKVREIVHGDFTAFESILGAFADLDACFYCLGVTAVGMTQNQYHHLTYDLTLAAATALASTSGDRLTFCYVSGEGTDSTERGRSMWARVKGKTENALLRLPFKAAFMFRPGYIQHCQDDGDLLSYRHVSAVDPTNALQALSLPAGDHQSVRVALLPLQREPARRLRIDARPRD